MIVTNDHDLYERACSLRNLAFGRPRFLHEELGYNYRMTNLQAALGLGQFNRIESIIHRKRWIASEYTKRLKSISNLQLPIEQSWAHSVYWMYCIVVKEQSRDLLMEKLYEAGIETRTMFCPMNLQPSLLKLGAVRGDCPVAEYLWHHGLYLPSGNGLTEEEIEYICDVIDSCV
jgi:perosamine synthetase